MVGAVTLYAFGSNACGQLGIGHTKDTSLPQPCQVSDGWKWPAPIARIRGGGSHTLVLLESGDLYASGSLSNGRTGLDFSKDSIVMFQKVPRETLGCSKVKLCSALWEASVVVTEDNKVYTFGLGPKGELGAGEGVTGLSHNLDRLWPPEEQIIDLESGISHTVIVLSNGDVYGWGNGRKGQLGEPAEIVWKPRKIPNLDFKVERAVCGKEFSYLVGDPGEGHHVVLGSDKWNVISVAPAAIPGWQNIGASWGSIFVTSYSGGVCAWGRNDHGQLGPDRCPEYVEFIAAGSEHALALTIHNNVAAWGWGEHGNCGPGIDERGDVKGWYNDIQADGFGKASKVMGVAAGCATSFVWIQAADGEHSPKLSKDQADELN
ncbi:MAG: hypothetical protein LQ338_002994 [Usnochroma carphineum]|nr:MAG: hypothetical protein LQ338_002994 [Usnochroma carphineum]